jgi:hypothetical protein
MPKLFVANVSKQIHQFAYRALERNGVIIQPIPIGGQITIAPNGTNTDLTTPEIDFILNQNRKYGLVSIEELDNSKDFRFNGICFSIGKPLTTERLRRAMQRNEEVLEAMGREIRKEAAVAAHQRIEEEIGETLPKGLRVSIEEQEPRGGYNIDDHAPVADGFHVTREAPADGTLPFIRGRRRA